MESLFSTDPLQLYTKDCAALVLALPGTLNDNPCVSTVWYHMRTLLTLAASYPRLLCRANTNDSDTVNMLEITGVWKDFGDACESTMSLLGTEWFMDITIKPSSTYIAECFPNNPKTMAARLTRETQRMERTFALCKEVYRRRCYNEKKIAARETVDLNFVRTIEKTRLFKVIVRGMMATADIPFFDRLKYIFLKALAGWEKVTPRLQSCANVTLCLCDDMPASLKVKLMASLCREVCVAGGITPTDFYGKDDSLIILRPDLLSHSVFFSPDTVLVFNLKTRCLGVVTNHHKSVPSTVLRAHMNMLAYAVRESARKTLEYHELLAGLLAGTSRSGCVVEYVKVSGVPSNEDDDMRDMSDYIDVRTLGAAQANTHGFLMWDNKNKRCFF